VKSENDVDGYNEFIKRVCFGMQFKPKALERGKNYREEIDVLE